MTATIQDVAQRTTPLPLLAFVHVPKTAGSTVNAVLDRCSPRGVSHCEEILYTDAFLGHASACDWLSGHIARDVFSHRLIWLNRPVEYFASTREPIAQLLSSLNWHFEISHRGTELFLACSVAAQRDIAEVQATDFSRLYDVMALLLKPDSGFLNCQARYILGVDFESIADSEKSRRLNSYCYIATEQTLPDLYQAFGFAEIPRDAHERRENAASKYHFDTTIFRTPELRAFLAFHQRHDIALYDLVRQTSWSAQGRHPFRPAFHTLVATPENYDEQAYLDANPDVAAAVRANAFRSGRDHFDAFGHAEGRRQLGPPPVPQGSPQQTRMRVFPQDDAGTLVTADRTIDLRAGHGSPEALAGAGPGVVSSTRRT